MKQGIITISREFGSGGRTIGKMVAQKLGIPCYDAELITEMAKQSGFAESYVKEAGEYTPGGFLDALLTNRNSGPPMRTSSGRFSAMSLRIWQRRAPASLSAGVRTLS